MNCDTITKQLPLMMYGELSFDEEEQVHQHLEACAACRYQFENFKALHRTFDTADCEIPSELLQNCRRNLRITVAALNDAGLVRGPGPVEAIRRWWNSTWMLSAGWKPIAALGLLAAGFIGGQAFQRQGVPVRLPGQTDPTVSRVRYVQPDEQGNVRLVVEEVRQRVMSGALDDSRIRNLLLSAAREANDPGVRVETMDLLKSQSESVEVRRALLSALQTDTNPGVRLKAIEALRGTTQDQETRRVLAQVLMTDDNPGVRKQAIDLLTERREQAMVGVLQEVMSRENNDYVRLKCRKALHELNASAESF